MIFANGVDGPDPRLEKLPRWARERILTLEKNVDHYKREAYQVANVDGDSTNTWIEEYKQTARDFVKRGLPVGTRIRFRLPGDRNRYTVEIGVDEKNACIQVHGWGALAIIPRSSNSVEIRKERDEK
jgi:hypothetical protein